MISVAEARHSILAAFTALPAEQVGIDAALGRVLATDLAARVTQPPLSVSAMDGYAVRAADVAKVPATLNIIGEAPAGGLYEGEVGPGETVRIFTGGPLPKGADTIVIQENTEREAGADSVKVLESAEHGRYVRKAGLDFNRDDVLLEAGKVLTARDVGLAAAMNRPWLSVRRKPRVALLATGDEVMMPGDPLGPSQIVSSNGLALAAFVTACGGTPVDLGIARDNASSLRAMIQGAEGADLLLTTGGVSVGDHDIVGEVLGEAGLKVDFWQIAMRPGKPLMFGRLGDTPMVGLPGNPVSAQVCAALFVRPAMEVMLGIAKPEATAEPTAILGADLGANDRREDYLRARLTRAGNGELMAMPFELQDSSMMSVFAKSDCLIKRPPNAPAAREGERVEIIPLGGGILSI
ncbi:MAG: gephyrin-like molybdotransferase Glp [Alphaproteobacteria bacterium]